MAVLSNKKILNYFAAGDAASTTVGKGKALEDLICYVFEKVSGIAVTARNTMNTFDTEEIDVAFWNEQTTTGFRFLPKIILVECKNWSNAVGSSEVSWFDHKLRSRGQDFGLLIAAHGITGSATELNRAYEVIRDALRDKRQIVVITRQELEGLHATSELVKLIKTKLCQLTVAGASF